MNSLELCRDSLARRFPDRSVAVEAESWHHPEPNPAKTIRFAISICPGFNFEPCQRFSGTTLSHCLSQIDALAQSLTTRATV